MKPAAPKQQKPVTNLESVIKAQDKAAETKKKEQKAQTAAGKGFDPNDFMAAMSRGAQMAQE